MRQPSQHAVTVSTSGGNDQQPLHLVVIDTGAISAVFAPELGGRLLSLTVAGQERLWRNPRELDDTLQLRRPRPSWPDPRGPMSDWVNLGGAKIWPAPQGWSGPAEWPGPPDPVFGGGAWKWDVRQLPDRSARIMMESGADPRTGVRATRSFEFRPGGNGFAETVRFIANDRPARWAIWEVVQVPSAGDRGAGDESCVFVVSPDADPLPLVPQLPALAWHRLPDGRIRVPVLPRVGKLGFPGATGEIEYAPGRWRAPAALGHVPRRGVPGRRIAGRDLDAAPGRRADRGARRLAPGRGLRGAAAGLMRRGRVQAREPGSS